MEFNTNLLQETSYRSSIQGSYTVGSTYVISSSSVNAFRFAVNRTANPYRNVEPGELFNWCEAGVVLTAARDHPHQRNEYQWRLPAEQRFHRHEHRRHQLQHE